MSNFSLKKLLFDVQCQDRGRLISYYRRLQNAQKTQDDNALNNEILIEKIAHSREKTSLRRKNLPSISYPDLPVCERLDDIKLALSEHQVVIVAGETGSGKSTQLPKICLDLGFGAKGLIAHTQPRRLAARAIARRLSEETKMPLGEGVGFKIRFNDKTNQNTYLKVMTDGILLAEIREDKYLSQYEVIIIDEAHERSLNIDFLLGHLASIVKKRPDLKVIITSATIDQTRFSQHFNAPCIEVSGRSYPVEIIYQEEVDSELSGPEKVLKALDQLAKEKSGDVLVFLATERDIHETRDFLTKANLRHSEILPLFARLSTSDQDKIFHPKGGMRRIILSTNIAETSLTVPGIRYVIDAGEVRISRYSYRTKVQRLPIEPISQASANQRAGRSGRVANGICIRLYSEEDFLSRAPFTDPEILRTNLASVILQMESLKLGSIDKFPFIDKPDPRFVKDGYRLLHEIGAIYEHTKQHHIKITPIGREVAKFPLDPRFARMLCEGVKLNVLREVLIIVSFLSIQDPRERPLNFQQKSDEAHKQDYHDSSDFMGIIQLWNRVESELKPLTNRLKKEYCKRHFLSQLRIREWQEVYAQLLTLAKANRWQISESEGSYAYIHQALLCGLLGHIGFNYESKEYLGARGVKFHLFPGSSQFKKTPKWIVSAELMETSKLYARMVAKIDPKWLEHLAAHLTKKHYSEPYWSQKKKAVMAKLRISLYGLDIVTNRAVDYSDVEPVISRELFIRHALVYGEFQTKALFFKKNLALLSEVEDLEHRARKRDIVIDDETLFSYYDKLIPEDIAKGVDFESWYKGLSTKEKEALIFEKSMLMQHDADNVTDTLYPDTLSVGEFQLPLSYHFDPTDEQDGVSVKIPAILVNRINPLYFEWLVPGLLEEKIIALIKALPKSIRKACVPAPHYAKAVLEVIDKDRSKSLKEVVAKALVKMTGIKFDQSIWDDSVFERHLQMRYEIIDNSKKVLQSSRDFYELKVQIQPEKISLDESSNIQEDKKVYQSWDFGILDKQKKIQQHGIDVTVYPCLINEDDEGVSIGYKSSLAEANHFHLEGVRVLLMCQLKSMHKLLRDSIFDAKSLNLFFAIIKDANWQNTLLKKSYDIAFSLDSHMNIQSKERFESALNDGKGKLVDTIVALSKTLFTIMQSFQDLNKKLGRKSIPLDLISLYQSLRALLSELVYPDFIGKTPVKYLTRIPFYIQSLQRRLEKAPRNLKQDRSFCIESEALLSLLNKVQSDKNIEPTDARVIEIRWQFHELWIARYAQEIKTIMPISETRVKKQILSL